MANNYYDILGVPKSASPEEIKRAYRKLAHQFHPDKGAGNEQKFKEVNEAYQVLGSQDKRKQYDTFGTTFNQNGGGYGGGNPFEGFSGAGGPGDEDTAVGTRDLLDRRAHRHDRRRTADELAIVGDAHF